MARLRRRAQESRDGRQRRLRPRDERPDGGGLRGAADALVPLRQPGRRPAPALPRRVAAGERGEPRRARRGAPVPRGAPEGLRPDDARIPLGLGRVPARPAEDLRGRGRVRPELLHVPRGHRPLLARALRRLHGAARAPRALRPLGARPAAEPFGRKVLPHVGPVSRPQVEGRAVPRVGRGADGRARALRVARGVAAAAGRPGWLHPRASHRPAPRARATT